MVFNRITIVGNSASGKSILAETFGKAVNLPVFHIDLLLWEPNWGFKSEAEFDRAHADWLKQERWVIEGIGYHSVLLKRFAAAEKIVFLDTPLEVCRERAKKRMEEDKVTPNPFVPTDCRYERMQQQQIDSISNFHYKTRPLIIKLLDKDFAIKPQVRLNGCLSIEELCSQIAG
jgi:adenylate kinase family enzyme